MDILIACKRIHYEHDETAYINPHIIDQLVNAHRPYKIILADPVDGIYGLHKRHLLCELFRFGCCMQDVAHEVPVADEPGDIMSGNHSLPEFLCIGQSKFIHFLKCMFTVDDFHQFLNGRGIVEMEADDATAKACPFIKHCNRNG